MDSTVVIQIILAVVALATLATPIITILITNYYRRLEKAEDYARQDIVAAKAAEAARKVEEVAVATAEQARLAAAGRAIIEGKVDQVHTLVNSGLTAQMKLTLTATKAQLASLTIAPSKRARSSEIKMLQTSIEDQENALIDREKAAAAGAVVAGAAAGASGTVAGALDAAEAVTQAK